MLRSAVTTLLYAMAAWVRVNADNSFDFHGSPDFSGQAHRTAASDRGTTDTDVGSEPVAITTNAPTLDGSLGLVVVLGCFVLVGVAFAFVVGIKAASNYPTRRQKQLSLHHSVDSTNANDTAYQQSLDRITTLPTARLVHGGRISFVDSQNPAKTLSGFNTIRGAGPPDRYAPPVQKKETTNFMPRTSTQSSPGVLPPLPPPSPPSTTSESMNPTHRTSFTSLLARYSHDFVLTPKRPPPWTPSLSAMTPPPLFSPHSPTHSLHDLDDCPRSHHAVVSSARASTFSIDDDSEVAM